MGHLILSNVQVYAPEPQGNSTAIYIEDGRIAALGRREEFPPDIPGHDAGGLLAAPGFIDLQCNGGWGNDFTTDAAGVFDASTRLPATGVTSFLPTIISAPPARYPAALTLVSEGRFAGAQPLGLHFEGPYLNPGRAGAHPPAWLRPPDEADLHNWASLSALRLVTLAPELPGALALARRLLDAGVTVSAGHSDATYTQAREAFNAGVSCVTHLFNAMRPFHHREPGLIGAALDHERVRVGLIADGLHVHEAALRLAWRIKGAERCFLVTDANAGLGQPAGVYRLGQRDVNAHPSGGARLADGTLAGSLLTMDAALRNLLNWTGCRPEEALRAASATPAEVIGWGQRKGRLAAGYDADIVLLTPAWEIAGTIIAGRWAWKAKGTDHTAPQ